MATTSLDTLKDELARRGLVADPAIEDMFVYGPARFDAASGEVMLNVDPEVEERGEFEPAGFAERVERILGLSEERWAGVIERVATEIEEAVGDGQVAEQTDLRVDLTLKSVVVFADATLLSFDAPKQFPDSVIRVQLDDDLEVDDLEVDDRDDQGTETLTFGSMDELLDHLSGERPEA